MQGIWQEFIDQYNKGVIAGINQGISQGRAEGISQGRAEERKLLLNTLLSQGIITPQQAEQFAQAE